MLLNEIGYRSGIRTDNFWDTGRTNGHWFAVLQPITKNTNLIFHPMLLLLDFPFILHYI